MAEIPKTQQLIEKIVSLIIENDSHHVNPTESYESIKNILKDFQLEESTPLMKELVQITILSEDSPKDLQKMLNNYLEAMALSQKHQVVDVSVYTSERPLSRGLRNLFVNRVSREYIGVIQYTEKVDLEEKSK